VSPEGHRAVQVSHSHHDRADRQRGEPGYPSRVQRFPAIPFSIETELLLWTRCRVSWQQRPQQLAKLAAWFADALEARRASSKHRSQGGSVPERVTATERPRRSAQAGTRRVRGQLLDRVVCPDR
jgi:hypothetical protein